MTVIDRFVQAVSHGGAMRPTLQVIHSAETPLRAGYAASIAENWFGKSAPTSAHFMVDPAEIVRMLSDNVVAYAVGPKANGFTLNWEQAGYARFTRAEWTTADGLAQMDLLAAGVRERGLANSIPLRWASDDDIRAAARGIPGGICFHDDIRRVLGGTSHTDPLPHYPRDLFMARVNSQEDDMYGANERNEVVARLDRALGLLESIHPAIASMHIGLMDPTSGVRTVVFQLAGRDPVRVDAVELAASLAPLLAPALAEKAGMTREDVEDVFRSVLGGLNDAA